jgi:hypothetical protein
MAVARSTAALLMLCLAFAQTAMAQSAVGKLSDEKLMGYLAKDGVPTGTVAWQTFRQVTLTAKAKDGKTLLPEFSPALKALDGKEIRIYGFVLPLSTGARQTHFLVSPLPSHCPYCVDQGPDSMIEVFSKEPIEYTQWEPMVFAGKLELVNDPYLFFRVTQGVPVKP